MLKIKISYALLFLLIALVACGTPTPSPVPAPTITLPLSATPATPVLSTPILPSTHTFTPTDSPSSSFTPTPTPPHSLTPAHYYSITEIAKGFGGPDDLALLADGSILFSDTGNGTIDQISPNGQVTTLLRGLGEPEGIVVLPDGSLIIAEQNKNRLLHFQPQSGTPATTWLPLENRTNNAGVDGLARDPRTGDIIIPDSPNGRVLRVGPDAKGLRVIATGMVRPTGAEVEPDGSILVADEYGDAVKRIRTNGQVQSLGHFATPDDVALDSQGNIFIASLGDNSIRMIDSRTGASSLVLTARGPQGILFDKEGNLIIAESGLNRIIRVRLK